jgi:cytoskeletal protein CcmA (bactofilin family)
MANGERPHEERRLVAWVGKAVVFQGILTSSEDLTLDGSVDGTIKIPAHALTLGPDSQVRADIDARSVTIHGRVVGTIIASERVIVYASGSVEGDITAPRVAIAEGAVVQGHVETSARPTEKPAPVAQPALA